MNDETVSVPEETIHSTTEPTSPPSEVPDLSSDDGAVTETEANSVEELDFDELKEVIQETGELTVEVIESVGSDLLHADLFGSFLICGTLIGLALLRNIHGT